MPFTLPKTWAFRDTVPAAEMQKYSNNLTYFRDTFKYFPRTCNGDGMPDSRTHIYRRCHKWLVYESRASGDSPTLHLLGKYGNDDFTESLPGDEDAIILDLDSIDWLVEGMWYVIDDVKYAFETD